MAGLKLLWHEEEPLELDTERMAGFYVDLGEAHARVAMERSIAALRRKLSRVSKHYATGNLDALARAARGIVALAEPLGLSSVSVVARDVARTAEWGDVPGLAATLARLERVAERSLKMMTQMQNF